MSSAGSLSELDALRSQVADLSRQLAERNRSAQHQREQSDLLRAIIEGTAAETGDAFFSALVTHLTSVLHIKYAFIGEVQGDHIKKIRTLAVSAGGAIVDNFEYALADTPCATALTQGFACFARGLQTMFPQFQRAADLGAESYCAVPLRTKGEAIMGLLVVMDTKPWQQGDDLRSLLEVFVPRIAAEFERRRAEQERAQALADLHNVIETIPDIVFALDTQGNVVKWNRRLGDVTGYSPAELWNKPALAFVPPEEQARTAAAIQRVFVEGYAELEGHLLTKERRLIPYHWTGALLKNTHGEPIGITGIGRDVSDKKRAEEALRESEHRFALAVEGSSDILWDALRLSGEPWYATQTQIWWSPRVRELLGLQASDSFETLEQWAARLHPDDKDRVVGQLAAHIEQRVPYDVEYRLRTNTGDYRWIRGRGQALWDEQGELRRMSGSCQDITKRKGVEEALRVSEERWHLAVRGSNDGIWDWDIQSGTVFFSPRWKAMRGFGEYEISSHVKEWQSRIHPDDLGRVLQSLDAYMAKQTPDFCEEYRTQRKDGSYMWILDRGLALWAEDGTPLRMVGSESDITEHKQALLRLAEQESLLRSILDTEPECVNRVADDGTILQMNKAGLCFIEADSFEQVAGRSVFDLVAPEFLERYRRMHEAVIRGASQPLEFQIVGLKGTRRWMETHAVPLRNPIDHRTEHLAITRDITHRKRTETALRESEERYRTLVDLSPNGVLVYSNGKKVYVNQAACRIMEAASPEQLLDNPTVHFSHPDDHESIRASIAQILATGEPVRRVERKYQRLDGTAVFVEVDAGRIMWNGEPAIQVIFADITERRQAEEALRKSEAQFRALAESTTDWMWEIDEQGRYTYCSPKIRDILGYEPSDALGKTPFDFMPEEEARRVVGLFGPIAAARKPFAGIENTNRHKDGRLVILECRGTPVIDDNGLFRGYRGFDQDITERKRVEASLLQSWLFLQSFVEHTPAAVAMLDRDLRYVVVSKRWYQDYQLSEPCIIGLHHYDVFPEIRGMEHWQAIHRRCLAGEILRSDEDRFCREDGRDDWLRWEIRPWVDESGSIGGIIMFTEDITERKQVEKALCESEERYRTLIDLSPNGVFVYCDGKKVYINQAACTILGASSPEHLLENPTFHFSHPDDYESIHISLAQILATGAPVRRAERKYQRLDGTPISVEVDAGRIMWNGEPAVQVIFADITQRKRAEQESHERILQVSAMQASLLELAHLDDTSLPFSTILPHVTRIVADVLAVERVSLWLLSGDQTELVCQDLYLRSQATHSAGSRLATSSYPRYLAVLKKSLMIGASNARVDQRTSEFADDYFLSLGITSVLDVPIRRQGKVIGVLWCEHVGMPREWVPEVQDFGASVGQTIARMIEASERRRAEISLRQSEERYRSLLDNAPIGIFVNKAGRFAYANREIQRILNATRAEQLLGMPVLDRIAPEFHSVGKDRIHQLMEKGQPVPSLDSQYVRLDGSRIDVAVTAIPTSFDGTDVIQVLVLDIAERKQAEQAQARLIEDLTRSRQHFQALFNWTPSAVGISTVAEGRFIDVNEGFSRLTGYMREEVIGRTTLELGLWADVSERESVLREILEQGYLHNREGLLRTKSGEIRSLMVSVESIQLGSIPCLIYLCHDITERKRMEDALRARERELQAALQERERISQDLHDGILQSLFGVGLNLEVTKSLMPQKTRKTAGGSLDKSIDQLNRVMREIRNFIAGLDSESFEGKDLPAALKHLLESLTENQPTRLRFAVEDRAAKALSAEQSLHLFRVIQEAVSNCIRHGHAQEARVSLKLLKQGVRLRIRDDGRGFSQDTVKTGGYGLRNMAARAKKIGGRFTVLSKENEGTRIILDLPKEAPHFPR